MRQPLEILNDIQIASPCPVPWSEMTGDDRVRHCAQCDRQVYDLSALTARQAIDLFIEKQGHLCIKLYRRKDGTVLTADCPVGVRQRARRAWRRAAATVAAALGFLWLGGCKAESDTTEKTTPETKKEQFECILGMPEPPQRQAPDAQGNLPKS